jgi:tRNA (guanine-N7-)-methyltransferase
MASRRLNDPFPYPNELFPDDWFQPLSIEDLFPETPNHPLEIDLGCGDGRFLFAMAQHYPERNFLGIERLLGRVRKIWRGTENHDLKNVRVLRCDSNYAVKFLIPDELASRIHFLCPDPWPKEKHASRRQMCQIPFLKELHRMLSKDGELLFKTDHTEYYEEALEVVRSSKCDFFAEQDWPDDAFFYPQTDFERQWLEQGKTMDSIRLVKV